MKNYPEYIVNMLKFVSASIGTGRIEDVDFSAWDEIWAELQSQDIHSIAAMHLDELPLNGNQLLKVMQDIGKSLQTFHELMSQQQELTDLLQKKNIPAVILKGAAAACSYPVPEYRRMGDIDILVLPEDFERAFQTLQEDGYVNKPILEGIENRHIGFHKENGKEIELHRFFSTGSNTAQNEILDDLIFRGIKERRIESIYDYCFPMLPTLENGIVLLAHINQHLASGLGLRQIVDWMMYVEKHMTPDVWEEFSNTADRIGMKQLAVTVTYMCRKYFGFRRDVSWCDAADETLADDLMEYIIENGCFGKKRNTGKRNTETVMIHFRNPIRAMRYLHAGGMCHWEAARKNAVLRPFAWIYQVGHLIRKGLERKVGVNTFLEEARKSKEITDLMERLGVTRM